MFSSSSSAGGCGVLDLKNDIKMGSQLVFIIDIY